MPKDRNCLFSFKGFALQSQLKFPENEVNYAY